MHALNQAAVHDRKIFEAKIKIMGDVIHLGRREADVEPRDGIKCCAGEYVATAHDVRSGSNEVIDAAVVVEVWGVQADSYQVFPGNRDVSVKILKALWCAGGQYFCADHSCAWV